VVVDNGIRGGLGASDSKTFTGATYDLYFSEY